MKRRPSPLQYNVHLRGDLKADEWPKYLDETERLRIIQALLAERMVSATTLTPLAPSGAGVQMLLRRRGSTGRILIHANDPMGVVYVLRNKGGEDHDPQPIIEYAITLQELRRNLDSVLEVFHEQPNGVVTS